MMLNHLPKEIANLIATYFTSDSYTTILTDMLGALDSFPSISKLYIFEIKENKFLYGESDDTENSVFLHVYMSENKKLEKVTIGNFTQLFYENSMFNEEMFRNRIEKILKHERIVSKH